MPVLDIGQGGGTRYTAGDARATISVVQEPEEARTTQHELPQQGVVLVDNLGFAGSTVIWHVTLRAKDNATYQAMIAELNAFKHGSARNAQTGVMAAADPALIRETQLTDWDGTMVTTRARLKNWIARRRRSRGPDWGVVQRIDLVFEVLG